MTAFARVVELGSFTAAAADLNLSPAIVGRHVADLEALLKLRLITRTTRSMEITEAGQRYYEGSKALLEQLAALEHDVSAKSGAAPSGVIRLAAPEGMGAPLLLDAIERFQVTYPEVLFDLNLDNDQTDFVSSQTDLAIRLAISMEDSALTATRLAGTRLCLFAAPSYLEKHGMPGTVEELQNHDCLAFGGSRFGDSWPLVTDAGLRRLRLPWRLVVNQTHAYRSALLRGMGIGLLPEIMALDLLASGHLQQVQLDTPLPEVGVFAVFPTRAFRPRRVTLFLEHLRTEFKEGGE